MTAATQTSLRLSAHFIVHPAGGGVPTHQHDSGQLTVVLGGTMRVTVDGCDAGTLAIGE